MPPKFEALHKSLTEDPEKGLPGVVLAVFNKDGIKYSQAAGRRKADSNDAIDLDSTFWGFSCTKLLTTICALQCVDDGLIGLDDPVTTLLPELSDAQIISSSSDQPFTLTPAKNAITLRHLLTHTSGLTYDAMNPLLVAWRKSRGEPPLVMSGKVVEAYSLPLLFEPGTSWVYGSSLDWAGLVVARLHGNVKLSEYMETHLFQRLGLKRSTFHLSERSDIKENLAQMFSRTKDGTLVPIPSPYPEDARDASGGMGIVTSSSDFIEILRDLLKDEPLLLKKETVSAMFTPQFATGTPQYRGLVAQEGMHKHLTGDTSGAPAIAFGLGGLVVLDGGVPNLPENTLAWNGMPNIGWFINRDRRYGAIYVSQVLPPADPKSVALLGQFWTEIPKPETLTSLGL
ncbi:hypothetical protein G7Z17_g3892 [Cylindrodendrum hubeiense]|uniref:Beta-lactamase-related domain-containing protein n=1 Tax=Cylindrodendrum hubeiense TaxID=595255 RepID=A0A9P5LJG7_9HYPO|nr:hypothetical protein G7Z17_g3892 [Cylindrodendrum hubeiense]